MTPGQIARFAVGPLGGALLSLVTLPVITWFFSQEDVGRMAMLQVTISLGTLVFSLGLDQAYVREYHDTENKAALLKNVMVPGFWLLLVTLAILVALGDPLSSWLFNLPEVDLSILVAIAVLAAFISRFLSLILRMDERGLAFSMGQILPKLLLLVIIGGYVYFGAEKTFTHLVAANTASIILVCFAFGWNTRTECLDGLKANLNWLKVKELLHFGVPLIAGGLAFWGLTATDKVFLRMLSSYDELGVYSVAVSFAAAATILQSVFSIVWAPTVYKWASTGKGLANVHHVTRLVLLCVVVLFSLGGLLSWVVPLVLPENYASVQWIFISCLGYPLLYTLSEATKVGIGIARRSAFSMLAAIIAFLFNLLGNWLLIPNFGAAGAAVSTCGAFLLFFVLRTEFSCYLWRPFPRARLYTFTIVVALGAIASTLLNEHLGWTLYGFWGSVLLCVLVAFRKDFLSLYRFLSGRSPRGGAEKA